MAGRDVSIELSTDRSPIDVAVAAICDATRTIDATVYKMGKKKVAAALREKAASLERIDGDRPPIRVLINESVPSKLRGLGPTARPDRTGQQLQNLIERASRRGFGWTTRQLKKWLDGHEERVQEKRDRKVRRAEERATTWRELDRLPAVEVKEWTHGKLHAKLLIVDEQTVYTGSYNWTKSAARKNTELMLEFRRGPNVRKFCTKFEELWDSDHAEHLQAHGWLYEQHDAPGD